MSSSCVTSFCVRVRVCYKSVVDVVATAEWLQAWCLLGSACIQCHPVRVLTRQDARGC